MSRVGAAAQRRKQEPQLLREPLMEAGDAAGGSGSSAAAAAAAAAAVEQAELLSLIISGEEEATREESDLGEHEGLANGHGGGGADEDSSPPVRSPGTSYWSITEGPDQPRLLTPAPGPSGHKPRVQRASRPGLSRIPGRDHRRYYHEYWRSEYLMDFDAQRHGMICMVCGSSLATLKLSTIKRHIRQKHPDSLLWSAADKEVIRSGWESHLSLGGQRSYPLPNVANSANAAGASAQGEESAPSQMLLLDSDRQDPLDPVTPQDPPQCLSPVSEVKREADQPPPLPEEGAEPDGAGPSASMLERYLNASLHAWFRQEFLMEYEAAAGRLLCMVCGGQLPSLHLDHIKSHVLDSHPDSLVYSSEQKHRILQAWASTHEESENSIKSEPDTKDGEEEEDDDDEEEAELLAQDVEAVQVPVDLYPDGGATLTQDTCLIGEDGGVGAPQQDPPPPPPRQPRKRRLRGGNPWRLRLDYLVAYGPQGRGTFCMVCSQVLHETKVSSFRHHIQECHPETTTLTRQERENMAAAWTKDYSTDEISPSDADVLKSETMDDVRLPAKMVKKEEGVSGGGGRGKARDGGSGVATPSRHGHYPGKDQRRNYQVRWRLDYLMDYDCRRHGLICMVCGATLATLKVSTIKRHIQQVHPHSLDYGPEEKQHATMAYNQTANATTAATANANANATHFTQSDDCFSSHDHRHAELTPSSPPPHYGS